MTLDFFKQNYDQSVKEQLIFVNAPDKKTKKIVYQIPCIYLDINQQAGTQYVYNEERKETELAAPSDQSDDRKIMLYFHGNAEDVGHNMPLMYLFREKFKLSVLAVEYPGYGFFSHQILNGKVKPENQKISCTAKKLATNSLLVFDHVVRPVE